MSNQLHKDQARVRSFYNTLLVNKLIKLPRDFEEYVEGYISTAAHMQRAGELSYSFEEPQDYTLKQYRREFKRKHPGLLVDEIVPENQPVKH